MTAFGIRAYAFSYNCFLGGENSMQEPEPNTVANARSFWCWAALLLALAGLAGSLSLSLVLHLKPCPLCYYQRTLMMGLVAVLLTGLIAGAGRLGLLALPLAVAGLGVASFHVYLEATGKLECPAGILSIGSAPQQSLALFAVLVLVLAIDVLRGPAGALGLIGTAILGAALAFAASTSNPPPPKPPTVEYTEPPDICRPPFRPS
jgi:disulfide bond formation protein DsbB